MKKKIPVGVSNHHIHITKETYQKLFSTDVLEVKKMLSEPLEFASTATLTLKVGQATIPNVRIVGPFRSYDQVEITSTDAHILKVNPPVCKSGDLTQSLPITLVGPCGEVSIEKGLIIANRHIHISPSTALEWNVKEGDALQVNIAGPKPGSIIAYIKIAEDVTPELHIDFDDANAFLLTNNSEVELEI